MPTTTYSSLKKEEQSGYLGLTVKIRPATLRWG